MNIETMRRRLLEQDWGQWFDLCALARGCVYAAAGRVQSPDYTPISPQEWEIQSVVLGQIDNLYGCCIQIATVNDAVLLMGDCDCPVHRNCKHAAALLFTFVCGATTP